MALAVVLQLLHLPLDLLAGPLLRLSRQSYVSMLPIDDDFAFVKRLLMKIVSPHSSYRTAPSDLLVFADAQRVHHAQHVLCQERGRRKLDDPSAPLDRLLDDPQLAGPPVAPWPTQDSLHLTGFAQLPCRSSASTRASRSSAFQG